MSLSDQLSNMSLEPIPVDDPNRSDVDKVTSYAAMAASADGKVRMFGVTHLRTILSRAGNPPISEVLDTGVLPRLVQIIQEPINPANEKLQFETIWVLTNIACGSSDHVKQLVDADVINPVLATMSFDAANYSDLGKTRQDLLEQAVWLLGNITGDSTPMRDLMLNTGFLENHIMRLAAVDCSEALGALLAFALSNCVRLKPQVDIATKLMCVEGAALLLNKFSNEDAVMDCAWCLFYASCKGDEEILDKMIDSGLANRMVSWMSGPEKLQNVTLKLIGSFMSSHDVHTQLMIDMDLMHAVYPILQSTSNPGILKETLWLFSNVAAGSVQQIQSLLQLPGVIGKVLSLFTTSPAVVAHEAAWVIYNIFQGGSTDQVNQMITANVMDVLGERVKSNAYLEAKVVDVVAGCYNEAPRFGVNVNMLLKDNSVLADAFSEAARQAEENGGSNNSTQLVQEHSHVFGDGAPGAGGSGASGAGGFTL